MDSLCDERGEVRLGLFEEAIAEVDFRRCRLIDEFDRPASRWRRYFGFKQFEFLGGLSEDVVFGCALVNIRYAASAFVYAYWPRESKLEEYSFLRPLGWGVRMDPRPEDGQAMFVKGQTRIHVGPGSRTGTRHLRAHIPGRLHIDAEWDEGDPPTKPLRICTRAGAAGWVYARKTAGQRVRGVLQTMHGQVELEAADTLGHRDWSAGYMRRDTHWLWGCLAGRTEAREIVGLNISCGVNETSFTENCFWVEGKREKIDLVHFMFDRGDLMRPWRMLSADRRCELEFYPEARHRERVRLGLLALNFHQLIGRYRGKLVASSGRQLFIRDQLGYAEWQYAKW